MNLIAHQKIIRNGTSKEKTVEYKKRQKKNSL